MSAGEDTSSETGTNGGGESRRQKLLEAAAHRFTVRGYEGTSIRDIARDVGMLPGSVYYHFRSKEELLLAAHRQGVEHVMKSVRRAVADAGEEPWQRLTAAATGHLDALLGENPFGPVITAQFVQSFGEPLRGYLIAQRDEYEAFFERFLDELPLPPDTDRQLFRLALLGSLNWTRNWYRPGGKQPADLANHIVRMFRDPLGR